MLFDVSNVSFCDNPLVGVYDVSSWHRTRASFSHWGHDLDCLRNWRLKSFGSESLGDALDALVFDSYVSLVSDIEAIVSSPIDTHDVTLWLRLYECVTSVSFIVTYPACHEPGLRVYDYVRSLAVLLGMVSDACDAAFPVPRAMASESDALSAYANIVVDFVCGRSAVWLGYILDMGRIACRNSDVSFDDAVGVLGRQRLGQRTRAIERVLDCNNREASRTIGGLIVQTSCAFDEWQTDCHTRAEYSIMPMDEKTAKSFFDKSRLEQYKSVLVSRENTDGYDGWCHVYGVSPVACMWVLPSKVYVTMLSKFLRCKSVERMKMFMPISV